MATEKKTPKLALVVGVGAKKDDDEDESYEGLDELAEVLGVAADKREEFAEAFKAAVMACK